MATPYERHAAQGHGPMGRYSPNGLDIIEECDHCGARFMHRGIIGDTVTLRPDPAPIARRLRAELASK